MGMTKRQIHALKVLRHRLTLTNARFASIGPVDTDPTMRLPTSEDQVDAFIRARTRIWRESWVVPVLNNLIDEGERRPIGHGHYVLDLMANDPTGITGSK